MPFEKFGKVEDEFNYRGAEITGSLDPMYYNYRKLRAAIILQAVTDYLKHRKGTRIHDEAYHFFKKVGYIDEAGMNMTGEDIIRYLDRNPKALERARKPKSARTESNGV